MKEGIKSGVVVCAFANGTMLLCVTLLLLLAFLNGKVGIQRRRRGRRGRPTSRIWIVRVGGGGGGGREVQQISRDFDNPLNVRLQPKQKKKITDMKKEGERKREKETEKCFFFWPNLSASSQSSAKKMKNGFSSPFSYQKKPFSWFNLTLTFGRSRNAKIIQMK